MANDNILRIISKLKAPQMFQKTLPRNGIEKIINKTSLNEAICLIAPYGYGKTSAVISWLSNRPAVWINLEEAASEGEFIAYFTASVIALSDDKTILENPEYKENPWGFLCKVASQLNDSDKILVIDNFRYVRDIKLIRPIKDFISACLGNIRIIIISRVELHPVFNDLMLKGRICLITLEDLSFSIDEISEYFTLNSCEVPANDIVRLHEETEGWPAALNVILTVSRGSIIAYTQSSRSYVKGFFETEIWNGLDKKIKDFLMKTSILKILTPSSCHAVTGIGSTLAILNALFFNGIFIIRLPEKNTYRYHNVFHDFLLDKLETSSINERELYMKAAWWLFEKREVEQSFLYFFKGRDLYGVSQALRILNPSKMGIEEFLNMTSCITTLNISELKPYPVIVARMALIHYMKGNLDEMQTLSDTFLEWTDPGTLPISPEEYAEYLWESGWLSYIDPREEVLNNIKHEEWNNYREYAPHLQELHRARGALLRFPSVLRGIRDYSPVLSSIEGFLMNVEKTGVSPVREEVSLWEAYLIYAEFLYETENFKKAEEIIRRIMPLAENQNMADLCFICTALLVKILRALRMTKEIIPLIDRLESIIINLNQQFLLPNFHAFKQRNMLLDGKNEMNQVFLSENRDYANRPYYYLIYRHTALARTLSASGNFNESLLILGRLELLCCKYRRTIDVIEINILKSIALYGLEHEEAAFQQLLLAVNESRKYSFIRIFSDDANELLPILEHLLKHDSDDYLKRIILSCKKSLAGKKKKNLTSTNLTKKELKILKALQRNMSYNDIALDNNIKITTVKSHIRALYSKLGVSNKTSAVMIAVELGIIKP